MPDGTKNRPSADPFLLMVDTSRVWFRDLECVYRGADVYAASLLAWGAISRGIFTPTEIAET